ncbi:exodeoxyribonuclease VII large subunit [Sulfuriferula sp. AH1]|uniref:exodeoxyribonuclease VII large subunit n=1 Tax=Sulfuriferula sp. AH1 TaxID=1985873 RepID=UPI000B3B70F0|nr:exodeoxyribonuclease VII large subunit [Sulfuriferula sp. AH1]ARU32856.1 exodeoxyribonuclease VII large subunit [Sulfuriferula sp. AH1]
MNFTPTIPILAVSAFNRLIQQTLASTIPLTWVAGEISNLTRAASGHWYFSLKDTTAQVRCVMFRGRNQYVDWQPENGMQVEVRATPGLYEPRGEFQLQVDTLRRAGLGMLFEAFERLKRQLEQEGLFADTRKRAIPAMPRRIGIITSPQAAALRDVLTTLNRKMPGLPVILYPCQVQGATAAAQIVTALNAAYQRAECDILIICRGGGSIEDLWSFNDETVARAVAASPIPIISGVGHETDFTITDFVADLRAPTPTAAAVLASPDRNQLLQSLDMLRARLIRQLRHSLFQQQQQLSHLGQRLIHPGKKLGAQQAQANHLASRLRHAYQSASQQRIWRYRQLVQRLKHQLPDPGIYIQALQQQQSRLQLAMHHQLAQRLTALDRINSHLKHLSPTAVLARGYSMVRNEQGDIIRDATQISVHEKLSIHFAHDSADVQVRKLHASNRLKK